MCSAVGVQFLLQQNYVPSAVTREDAITSRWARGHLEDGATLIKGELPHQLS